MRAFLVVEDEVARESPVELGYGFVAFDVEVFLFDGAPEPVKEDVVQGVEFQVGNVKAAALSIRMRSPPSTTFDNISEGVDNGLHRRCADKVAQISVPA